MHALVVDDDDFVRFLLVRTLGDLGFTSVDDASSASDALRLSQLRRPDRSPAGGARLTVLLPID